MVPSHKLSATSFALLCLIELRVIVFKIRSLVSQQTSTDPSADHDTQTISHILHQPSRTNIPSQTHLSRVQEQQQLRKTGRGVLTTAVFEIRVQVSEEALADTKIGGRSL